MNEGPPPKRVCLDKRELDLMSKEDLLQKWTEQETYIDALVSGQASGESNKQQYEAARRENVLVMRLTTKEQEMQEYATQVEELKRAQNPSTTHLRNMLLDPAINLMFQRMKKEMDVCKEKLEQAQNDLAAWKFTPDGQTGKRLMAKCRMLLQENEELGKVISSGRTAKLEGEIALQKKFVEEMKNSQAETDEFLVEMDEDVEGMQSTILVLQQQLKDAKDQIVKLQEENQRLRSSSNTATNQKPTDSASTGETYTGHTIKQEEHSISSAPTTVRVDSSSFGSNSEEKDSQNGKYPSIDNIKTETTTASNGQQEAMDTMDNVTDQPQQETHVVSNHTNHTNSHSPEHTEGKTVVTESPLSPVRTAPAKDTVQLSQSRTEAKVGAQTDEPIQNGLISSQYDSQDEN